MKDFLQDEIDELFQNQFKPAIKETKNRIDKKIKSNQKINIIKDALSNPFVRNIIFDTLKNNKSIVVKLGIVIIFIIYLIICGIVFNIQNIL